MRLGRRVGGGPPLPLIAGDDFEARAQMLRAEQRNPNIVEVSIAEIARVGAWSHGNQLGQRQFLNAGASLSEDAVNARQNILKLEEWGFPEVWTISLGIEFRGSDPSAEAANYQAEIVFGSGGATETVIIDWIRGTSISLPMNAVEVNCLYDSSAIADNGVSVQVLLSRGARWGGLPPVVTIASPSILTTATSPAVEIPKFVRRVKFANRGSTAASSADFYNAANVFRLLTSSTPINHQSIIGSNLIALGSGFDVFGGAHLVEILNGSANTISARIYGEIGF